GAPPERVAAGVATGRAAGGGEVSKLPRPDAVTENYEQVTHPGEDHEWFLPARLEEVLRDDAGRRNPNGGTRWLVLRCNEWPCKAVRLVRLGAIRRLAGDQS